MCEQGNYICANIPYTLNIKQVKNINLRISRKGEVVVSASPFVQQDKIEAFINEKATWIKNHLAKIDIKNNVCDWNEEYITLFGKKLKIKKIASKKHGITYDDSYLYIYYNREFNFEKSIQNYLDKQCDIVFNDIVLLTYNKMEEREVQLPKIQLRQMKSRWGSCTPSKNKITLNKKLIHYPLPFVEYVVLHELAHFVEQNHSQDFYNIIKRYMPDYKQRKILSNM